MLHCEKAARRHDGRRLKATASLPPGGSRFRPFPSGRDLLQGRVRSLGRAPRGPGFFWVRGRRPEAERGSGRTAASFSRAQHAPLAVRRHRQNRGMSSSGRFRKVAEDLLMRIPAASQPRTSATFAGPRMQGPPAALPGREGDDVLAGRGHRFPTLLASNRTSPANAPHQAL